jgi:hypothetical protein
MQFIEFRDHCVISRDNGGRDEWDNPVNPEEIYNGPCCYQEGGTSYNRIFITRNPTVFLPGVDVQVNINDEVKVTTEFGREIFSIAKIVRDINMPWRTNVMVTRIELKQAQGE